jgi:hypothetical protein
MANRRFIDFPIASTVGDNDIVLIWQDGLNKQTTKGTLIQGAPTSLEGLTDVDIAGLINGQILQYNSVTGKWENVDRTGLNLSELGDVSIVSPSNGQVLVYNSTTSKWENSSAGYVPYVGAVTTVDLGAQGLRAGYVRFNTSVVSVPNEQGLMYWDGDDETIAVILNGYIMKIGEDQFYPVKNQTGSSIAKGTAVRFAGTLGASGRLLIAPFIADGSVSSSFFMGVTAEAIADGEDGKVLYFGRIRGINTNAFNEGDVLYASTTVAGGFQTAVPVAPNNIVQVAAVITKSINQGVIFIRPSFGSNINQDEGVKIVSVANLDLLQYQSGTALWENKTIDGAGIVTKATTQTISGVKTFSQDIDVNGVNVGRGGGNAIENTRLGNSALSVNTTGTGNTAAGSFALSKNTTGGGNTAVGTQTLQENTTGSGNTGLGWASLFYNTTGSNNSAFGYLSLYENTTGQTNVGIGFYSLFKNTTGSDNTALGYISGAYIADGITENSITNGSVFIGTNTRALANNQTNQIVIGHNAIGNGSNTVTIGNGSIANNYFTGNIRGGAFIKSGGTSAQFLKADGSVDSTSYGTGSVTSVGLSSATSGVTIGSSPITTSGTITLAIATASGSQNGLLSSTDWTTFNGKQNALTNPVTGTGTTNYLPKFTGASTIGNSIMQESGTTIQVSGNVQVRGDWSSTFSVYQLLDTRAGGAEWNIENGRTLGNLEFYNGAAGGTKLTLNPSGNLGLGVTPSAWTLFSGVLELNGGPAIGGFANTTYFMQNVVFNSGFKYKNTDAAGRYELGGQHSWYTAPSGTAGNAITFTQAMTLGSNSGLSIGTPSAAPSQGLLVQGNVGIGTGATSPNNLLHLNKASGTIAITLQTGSNFGYLFNDGTNIGLASNVGSTGLKFLVNRSAPDNSLVISSTGAATFSSSVTQRDFHSVYAFGGNIVFNTTWSGSDNGNTSWYSGGVIKTQIHSNGVSYFNGGNVLIGTTTSGSSKLRIVGLPTSAAGLSSGDVYNLAGSLMIA